MKRVSAIYICAVSVVQVILFVALKSTDINIISEGAQQPKLIIFIF